MPLRRGEQLPGPLRPVALLTFRENVRRDAASTLEYFREQDVGLRIISGDNPIRSPRWRGRLVCRFRARPWMPPSWARIRRLFAR